MKADTRTLRRIGVFDQSASGWAASASYTKMLLHSLASACAQTSAELFLFTSQKNSKELRDESAIKTVSLNRSPDYLPGERTLRRIFGLGDKSSALRGESHLRHLLRLKSGSDIFASAQAHGISVLLPLFDVPPWDCEIKTIGWIPDFQHIYLPQFFSEAERKRRNESMHRLAERATRVMLSSHSALEHFTGFAPHQAGKGRVISFPSLFAFEPPAINSDAISTRARFNLPEKFVLVANQFWAHKNHLVIVEAVKQLKTRGVNVPIVMTGLPADHRDPTNENLSRLLQAIAAAGLSGQITVLGRVPYTDLINLMRTCAAVIQPSRFEGWSTIVEDAKALGRPLFCSDLAVHREQAAGALGFFDCDNAATLAGLLDEHWNELQPGPDTITEMKSLAAEQEFAKLHGQSLLALCHEACSQ